MYLFGEFKNISNEEEIKDLLDIADSKKNNLANTPIRKILFFLDELSKEWQVGGYWYNLALNQLPNELSFSKEMIKNTLDLVSDLLCYDELEKRLLSEFGTLESLDEFSIHTHFEGKIQNFSLGKLLHVSAGNVFLGCIDSLLMGFLTKNINILKLSSKNQTFPKIFAESILKLDKEKIISDKFAILYWKGGDENVEKLVKNNIDAIIAWGGESMLESYKKDLPINVKLLDYGPKISIQVITKEFLNFNSIKTVSENIVNDIALWDQAACASSQNLFIEDGVDVTLLMNSIADSFNNYKLSRAKLDQDEYVDILKEKARADYSYCSTGIDYIQGDDFMIHFDPSEILRPSPLNRTLIIKPFKNILTLSKNLENFKFYLQTCGIGISRNQRNEYLRLLALAGIKRFTPIGKMLSGMSGAPHDGKFGLRDLVNTVSYEQPNDLDEFLANICDKVAFFDNFKGKKIQDFPLTDGETILLNGPGSQSESLLSNKDYSFIFASGGTSGSPKYSMYKAVEFEKTCKLLAKSYILNGLEQSDVVANLFVSGNMWSSFSAVQLALQYCPITQLPIGGKTSIEDIQSYFNTFKPNVVFGLPGMLVDLALKTQGISVSKVFYAGEAMNDSNKKLLEKYWGVNKFISAGYASVDVGPIGFQVPNGKIGEHYFFDHIYPEIINNELFVTSTLRESMPIVRYKTGDQVRLLEKDINGQKFMLLARSDKQIQIWSCRFYLNDIGDVLNTIKENLDYQVILKSKLQVGDIMQIFVDCDLNNIDDRKLLNAIYKKCKDIEQTISFEQFCIKTSISNNSFVKNERTGKSSKLIDLR